MGLVDSSVTVFDGDTGSISSYFWNWYGGYAGDNYHVSMYAAYIATSCRSRYGFLMDWAIYLPRAKISHFVFKIPGVTNTTPDGGEFTLYVTSTYDSAGSSNAWDYAIWYYSKSYSGSLGSKIQTSTSGASVVQFKQPAITGKHHTEVTTIYNNSASEIGTNWSGWVGVGSCDATRFITKIIYHP